MTARRLIFFFLPFIGLFAAGQTRSIDSLKKNIFLAGNSQQKLLALFAFCELRQSLHTDTLARYADMAMKIADADGTKRDIRLAEYFVSNYMVKKGWLDSALRITERDLKGLSYENDRDLYLKFIIQKGQILIKSEKYKEALELFFSVLNKAEEAGDFLAQANSKTNIGWIRMEMNQNEEALKAFYEALKLKNAPGMQDYLGVIYSNMAATYNELNRNDSAEAYINKAIAIERKNGKSLSFLANALAIQADIFTDTKRNSLAEQPLNEALKIRQQIGEPFYIVSDMTELAIFYASNNETDKGIVLCKQGIDMANKFGLSSKLLILYQALAANYEAAGQFKEYANTLNQIINIKDSVYQRNSADALAAIQGKYDLQKKENTIIRQKLDLTKKNYLFFGSLALTAITLIAVYSMFRSYNKRHQLKLALMREEEKRLGEEAVMRAEEKERKRISADLHDNLGVYAASIASNIDHILLNPRPAENRSALEELRENSQSMVSQLSDTIWALKKDALSLTAISDRLKLVVQRIEASYPTIKIDVIENIIDDHLLPPSQAFHLFQILKEGINNALKHSGCKQIFVIIDSNAVEQWRVSITDDGRGIQAPRAKDSDGHGLLNMRSRSKEAGWKIEWQINQPSGTSVIIEPSEG